MRSCTQPSIAGWITMPHANGLYVLNAISKRVPSSSVISFQSHLVEYVCARPRGASIARGDAVKPCFAKSAAIRPARAARAGMEGLGHRAELLAHADRLRCGDAERHRRLRASRPQEARAGGRRAEHSRRAGDVPAAVVVVGIDRVADAACDVDAEHEGVDQLAAAGARRARPARAPPMRPGRAGMDDRLAGACRRNRRCATRCRSAARRLPMSTRSLRPRIVACARGSELVHRRQRRFDASDDATRRSRSRPSSARSAAPRARRVAPTLDGWVADEVGEDRVTGGRVVSGRSPVCFAAIRVFVRCCCSQSRSRCCVPWRAGSSARCRRACIDRTARATSASARAPRPDSRSRSSEDSSSLLISSFSRLTIGGGMFAGPTIPYHCTPSKPL